MEKERTKDGKMGLNATWSMAVGGMVGGGIFSVLGVVVSLAGHWAWLSFVIAGLIALATALAYSSLAARYGEGGGAFTFLRKIHRDGPAGSLSWVLVYGYTLTISVYAFTFGHYLGYMAGFGPWFPRFCALAIVIALVGVNLLGVGEAAGLEIVTVWAKLAILLGLAGFGLWLWQPERLIEGTEPKGFVMALVAAASIFMAYEGFQLLSYDYEDIRNPDTLMPRAMAGAVVTVIAVYVAVALGAVMLVGAETIIEKKEVAIAVAGRKALGTWGLVLATVAALFSTGSAINATLFATARLAKDVAEDGELPRFLSRMNSRGVPSRSVLAIGGLGGALALVGSLENLVEAASLVFLFTFATVNVLAWIEGGDRRWVFGFGAIGAGSALVLLFWRLLHQAPFALGLLTLVTLLAVFGRPWILRKYGSGSRRS